MEVCYDEGTKTWSTRPLAVKPSLREMILGLVRKIIKKIKSFLKLD
jgi:hypothetical protein